MSDISTNRVQFEEALLAIFLELYNNDGTGGDGGTILASRLSIINYVKAKLDELIPEGEGLTFNLSTSPNISNPLDLLINAHIDEATKDVILTAPLSVLYPVAYAGTAVHTGTNKFGYIVLPANYLRLSSFKMTDWLRDVSVPITPQNPIYKKQSNEYLRGGTAKPIAVLNWKNLPTTVDEVTTYSAKRILEYYSVDTVHTIDKLLYIPEQVAEDFVAVNPDLLPSLAWMCAAKILQITRLFDAAKLAMEQVTLSYTNL